MTKKKSDKEFVRIRLDNKIEQDRSDIRKWAKNNGKASGDFANDLYRLIRHYLDENVDPGATQFLLIREAMNMGLQVSKPDHLLSIATALTAILAEIDLHLPDPYRQQRGQNETTH